MALSCFATLLAALAVSASAPLRVDQDSLRAAFTTIRASTTWPVPGTTFDALTSAFGPRIRVSTMSYDWHRGVDIHAALGTPAVAAADGVLWDVADYVDGGTTVILKHPFPAPVSHHGKVLTCYYTFYMHLSAVTPSLVAAAQLGQHPAVTVGAQVGEVGHSGSAVDDHLHFELRVGTQCTLEFQLANPGFSCAGWGFDPAMNPLWMFPPLPPRMGLALLSVPSSAADGRVRFVSSDDQPLLDKLEFTIVDHATQAPVASHVLDFNERDGFDPTSTAALDTIDPTRPYMAPKVFGASPRYSTEIVLPAVFVASHFGPGYDSRLTATDIWNRTVTLAW